MMKCYKCSREYQYNSQNLCILHSDNQVLVHLICDCNKETLKILTLNEEKEIINVEIVINQVSIKDIIDKTATNPEIKFFDNSDVDTTSTCNPESTPEPYIDTNKTVSLCHYEPAGQTHQVEVTGRGFVTNKEPTDNPITKYTLS